MEEVKTFRRYLVKVDLHLDRGGGGHAYRKGQQIFVDEQQAAQLIEDGVLVREKPDIVPAPKGRPSKNTDDKPHT